ncbi:MAG: DUF2617 family protein [Pirellulales bacterium]|nr:DUF2617 family protein [Pirellulales bacterium]
MLSVRPKVTELVFQLYSRSLHPELFEIYQSRTIQRGNYEATVQITAAGHLVTWKHEDLLLTEVATSAHQPLPKIRRLMSHRLKGDRSDRVECRGGIHYEMSFSLEPTQTEKFLAYQQQLTLQATRQGMLQEFEASGRLDTGALSYINIDSRDKAFRVQAFHAFPDDCAVLKIQSLFQLPE